MSSKCTIPSSSSKQQTSTDTIASHPFDDKSGDVILRSSNHVLFYVHKVILSYASGFFRVLLTLDRPQSDNSEHKNESPPTIDMAERSIDLQRVLLWCYPVPHPEPGDLSTIEVMISIAAKYAMEGVLSYIRRPLRDELSSNPLRVFAISCKYSFPDVAILAADSLRTSSKGWRVSEDTQLGWAQTIPYKIYNIHTAGIRAASAHRLLQYLQDDDVQATNFCEPSPPPEFPDFPPITLGFPDADLIIRSQLNPSNFKVHRQIISFSSPLLKSKIPSDCLCTTSVSSESDGLPILELPEEHAALGLMLQSCYPIDNLGAFDPAHIPSLVHAAEKYGVHRARDLARKRFVELLIAEPFRAFCVAIKCDWKAEARDAAVQIAQLSADRQYHPSMENLDAKYLFLLLQFCHEYRRVLSLIHSPTPMTMFDDPPAISEILSQYHNILSGEAPRYPPTAICLLSLMATSSTSDLVDTSPTEYLQNIHKEVTSKLPEVG